MKVATSRESVLSVLNALSDKDLVELLYAAIASRTANDVPGSHRHLVVGDAACEPDGDWRVDLFGVPQSSEPWASDAPICQSGTCSTCGSNVRSWAKQMLCPVCRQPVYGT